jgi:xylan 1,4-beta-xylosidase
LLSSGCYYPPNNYDHWGDLIRTLATHVSERYADVVPTWPWELWNEPDIGYWHARNRLAEYTKLYDYTEAALHQTLPDAPLGGPAVASVESAFFREFLQHCTGAGPVPQNAVSGAASTRLDLISFHAKGGVALTDGHVRMNLGNQLRLHQIGFGTVADFPDLKTKPIVISEADPDGCAACTPIENPEDAYRNSPAYAAYVVAMMKRTLELGARQAVHVAGLVTWAFLFDPNDPSYFPGYRALSAQGIDLPVLNAFKLLGRLEGHRLPVQSGGALALDDILAGGVRGQPDVDAMATLSGRRIQVLAWHYHDDLVPAPAARVGLSVKIPPGFGPAVLVTRVRADGQHGDAYTAWTAQGRPATPTAAQRLALLAAMEPLTLEPAPTVAVTNGEVRLDFELPRFGITLVTLTPGNSADVVEAADPEVGLRGGGGGCACALSARRPDEAGRGGGLAIVLLTLAGLRRRGRRQE